MDHRTLTQRRRLRSRLATVGMALMLALGAPAVPDLGPVTASEAAAQWPQDRFRLCFWNIEICIAACVPGFGFCCEDLPGPLL